MPRTVPGFETFYVTYDMMATPAELEEVQRAMNAPTFDRSNVILDWHGWPDDEYPGGPFSDFTPMAVLLWIIRLGYGEAVASWVNDPNSLTA